MKTFPKHYRKPIEENKCSIAILNSANKNSAALKTTASHFP